MTDLLVSLVGMNPLSALLCARATPPKRVLLVATDESKKMAERVSALLDVEAVISLGSANPGIDALVEELVGEIEACLPSPSATICLDITGATKPLSIAAWLACARFRGRDFEAIYLERDGRLVGARDASPLPSAVSLEPADFVRLRGGRIEGQRWTGSPARLPAELLERRVVAETMFRTVAAAARAKVSLVDAAARIAALTPGLPVEFAGRNEWLEELCLAVACDVCAPAADVRAGLGVSVRVEQGGLDEIDVVLTRGARAVVIEAKTNVGDAGKAIRNRESKVREVVDALAQLVFVCPAWADSPPHRAPHAATTHLVGGNLRDLARAVSQGLGL